MELFAKKKGQLSSLDMLSKMGLGVVIFIITVAIGATIIDEIQDTQTASSIAYNTSEAGLEGMSLFGDFVSIIVLVSIAAVILSLIAGAFGAFRT